MELATLFAPRAAPAAPTPNRENIRKWVDALRSGNYTQTNGALHDTGGYCCLGVACDVAYREGAIAVLPWDREGEDNNNSLLSHDVRDWLGVESTDPILFENAHVTWNEDCTRTTLAACDCDDSWAHDDIPASGANDDYNKTFDEIADLVEERYLKDKEDAA